MANISLARATPESHGVDPAAIAAFIDAANEGDFRLHSLMILRHGEVIAEGWWKPYAADTPHMMFSVSKSVTATAIGIAQDEGLLSVDDPILSFFPSYATEAVKANVRDLRVRHLLAMATGHAVDTMEIQRALPNEDWVKVFLGIPIEYPPGTHFLYNSGASFVLSAIITARTGLSPRDYLIPRLFEPLGMDAPPWESNPRGINFGASGLRLRTEELAKLGQLYLQRGVWNGSRLLSEHWIDTATAFQVSNGSNPDDDWGQGYGFQIWRSLHDSYRMDGRYGQFTFVLPHQDVVVAVTSGTPGDRSRGLPPLLWRHLLPGIHGGVLPDQPTAREKLTSTLENQTVRVPEFVANSAHDADLAGVTMSVPFNTLHVTSVRLDFDSAVVTLTTTTDVGAMESVPAGRIDWIEGSTSLWPYEEMDRVVTQSIAGWVSATAFEVHQQCVETPFSRSWLFELAEDGRIVITVGLDNGFWVERTEVLDGVVL